MKPRLDIGAVSPAAYRSMLGLEKFIHESGIEGFGESEAAERPAVL